MDWSQIEEHFETMPGVAYLNTGTCGRTPRPVMDAAAAWRTRLAAEPCEILWRRLPESLWPARKQVAQFVGATLDSIMFMANVTAGVNTITNGLQLEPRRDILVTDQEYGAMVYAWERRATQLEARIRAVALPTGDSFSHGEIIGRFEAALDSNVQLLFLSHITTATGFILPVREICEIARDRGVLTVIDGAHAPGMIAINLQSIGCDFYAANGHKWLCAPAGSGFLYVRRGLEDRLEPLIVSWGWKYDRARTFERDSEGSTPYIRSHEFQGTRDPAPWLSMPAAIEFQRRLGIDQICERDRELATLVRKELSRLGLMPLVPSEFCAALCSYRLPTSAPEKLQRQLWDEFRIETPVLERSDGERWLRVSTHFYNTESEVMRLRDALQRLLSR